MKLKCKKCGAIIVVPPEVKKAPEPRVECPSCGAGYRLRRGPQTSARPTGTLSSAARPTGPLSSVPSSPWKETRTSITPPETPPTGAPSPEPSSPSGLEEPDDDQPTQLLSPSMAARHRVKTPAPVSAPQAPVAEPAKTPPASSGASPPVGSAFSLQSTPGGSFKLQAFAPEDVLSERYRIVRFLAHGGMGEVYEAEDLELKQRLALKTISPAAGATQDVATIDRFKREIALARAVTHPNVCRIFDLGQHTFVNAAGRTERINFLTMELLQGETLAARLRRRKRLSPEEARPLISQMAEALDAAHRAKIVHRDFKSENVFLVPVDDRFRVVVTDFGVARGSDGADRFAAQVTGTGIVGTPSYMAPEQVEGKAVTPAADIYAFGVVIYEMLTGCLPFEGPTPLSTAVKRLQEAAPTPRIHVPDIPAHWERTIMRCLERQPEDRFTKASEVAEALSSPNRPPVGGRQPETPGTGTVGIPVAPPGPTSTLTTAASVGAPPATPERPMRPPTTASVAVVRADDGGRQKTLVAVLALVLLISAGLFLFNRFKDQEHRLVPRRAVAVLGFKNLTGQGDADWLSTALTEMMATELGRGEALRSISSEQVARVRQEMGIDDVSAVEAQQLSSMRSLLACDFVLTGSYTRLGDGDNGLRIDLKLRDAALDTAVATASRQGAEADLFPMIAELGEEVRGALGIGKTGQDTFAGLPQDGEASRLYAEALEGLRGSDPGGARQLLQQAVSREPTNALLHSALSSAWEAEGYRARAAQAAERAFELSSQLPQEDRLVVEGHFRELQGDWQAASTIYSSLWDFFPDDLDYGLRLVAAENNARRPDLALAAIDRLRTLPVPLSEDPRIDLAEATADALLGDLGAQLEAADRALQRADALGAKLLSAQAQIARSQALRRLGRMDEAAQAATSAQDLYRNLEHQAGAAMAQTALANALAEGGDFDAAAGHYRQAIETHRAIGDRATTASLLNNLALVLRQKGDLETAQGLYREAVAIYQETDNRLGLANTENNLGVLLVGRDQLADALGRFEQAKVVWEEAGDRAMQAYALNNLGAVSALQGKLWESRTLHQQALDIRQAIDQPTGQVTSLTNLAGLQLDLGELQTAQELLEQAGEVADGMKDRAGQAEVLSRQAALDLQRDQLDSAQHAAEQALALRQELLQERQVDDVRLLLARILEARGEAAEAEAMARDVVRRLRADQRPGETALGLDILARTLLAGGRAAEARDAITEALLLASDTERRAVGLQLEITASLVEAANGRPSIAQMQRLSDLERQIEADGYAGLRLEAALAGARLAQRAGRTEAAAQGLANVEAEASAAGFELLARQAREMVLE